MSGADERRGGWSASFTAGDTVEIVPGYLRRWGDVSSMGAGVVEGIARNGWIRVRWGDGVVRPVRGVEVQRKGVQ